MVLLITFKINIFPIKIDYADCRPINCCYCDFIFVFLNSKYGNMILEGIEGGLSFLKGVILNKFPLCNMNEKKRSILAAVLFGKGTSLVRDYDF